MDNEEYSPYKEYMCEDTFRDIMNVFIHVSTYMTQYIFHNGTKTYLLIFSVTILYLTCNIMLNSIEMYILYDLTYCQLF